MMKYIKGDTDLSSCNYSLVGEMGNNTYLNCADCYEKSRDDVGDQELLT